MPHDFQRFRSGDPLKFTRTTINAMVAAGEAHARGEAIDSTPPEYHFEGNLCQVRNDSASLMPRFAVAGIAGALITPTDNLQEFQNYPRFSVVTPAVPTHLQRFCILVDALPAGKIGLAMLSGVAPVQIWRTAGDPTPRFAAPQDGQTGYLVPSAAGAIVLSCAALPSSSAAAVWALVALPGAGGGIGTFELKTDLAAGGYADAYPMLADGSDADTSQATFRVYDAPEGMRTGTGRDTASVHGDRGHFWLNPVTGKLEILSLAAASGPTQTITIPSSIGFDVGVGAWWYKTRQVTVLATSAESAQINYAQGEAAGSDIQRDTTTIALSVSDGTPFGTAVALSATVSHSTGSGTPTGYIAFYATSGSTSLPLGSGAVLMTAGTATLNAYLPAGTWTLTAVYGGDASYDGSTSSGSSLTVAKATPTLTLNLTPNHTTYGDTVSIAASLSTTIYNDLVGPTGTIGLLDGATAIGGITVIPIPGVPPSTSYAGGGGVMTTTRIVAGTRTITANYSGDNNYNSATATATQTVDKKALTGTVQNAARTYGDANPGFSIVWSGFVNGQTVSVLTGSPTLSTSATAATAVGSYAITAVAGSLAADNYSFSFSAGTLTINPAPLTVTANSTSMTYGASVPDVSTAGSLSGIKNSDNLTFHGTTAATSTSNAATYGITAGVNDPDTKLGNYTLTAIAGTLTINPASLTSTADNASMVKDAALPTFTGTLTGIKNSDNIVFLGMTTADGHTLGSFTITASVNDYAGKLSNYTLNRVNATLTVHS